MYPNKPKASSMNPISRTNMLVKTMLLISRTSVSSSGCNGVKEKELIFLLLPDAEKISGSQTHVAAGHWF